ncbi:MAG: NAD-dependent epimerase/dehydratase family protein [Candidatus Omnitrophica bacterium]|nr:NAD-dependent epimerase/dehydratase family protein [Candidatus Omnitrophota bacterium]
MTKTFKNILVTGGAGYVGAVLVPELLRNGYRVKVLDLYLFGDHVLDSVKNNPDLKQIKGDIRDEGLLQKEIKGMDAVIHLACISNDPSFQLNPALGKSINYDAFLPLVRISKDSGLRRFIYASSSSVYGVKKEENVTEELRLEPITEYSKYKALCEEALLEETAPDFTTLIFRPATVCGYSPRQRLDLTVNILTNHAVNKGVINVFGGEQKRPNIHMKDMVRAYLLALTLKDSLISGNIFNVGYENYKIKEIAEMVRNVVGKHIEIKISSTDDPRSYHISSEKIARVLGFRPGHSLKEAILDLVKAFKDGRIIDPLENARYYNIKTMLAKDMQ